VEKQATTLGIARPKGLAVFASKSKKIALLNSRTIEKCISSI